MWIFFITYKWRSVKYTLLFSYLAERKLNYVKQTFSYLAERKLNYVKQTFSYLAERN